MKAKTATKTPSPGSLQRVVRRRPTRSSSTYLLDGGGVLHIDRRIVPLLMACDQCGKRSPNCAPDEGDGGWWCLDCIELWEKKHKQHWEDGSPLKPPNDKLTHEAGDQRL